MLYLKKKIHVFYLVLSFETDRIDPLDFGSFMRFYSFNIAFKDDDDGNDDYCCFFFFRVCIFFIPLTQIIKPVHGITIAHAFL